MARIYAIMDSSGALLYADRKGKGWRISDRRPDCGPQGRNLTLFVDGRDVLGLSTVLPAKNEREARRAAPYAVEDEIGEPVEHVHVALGPAETALRQIDIISEPVMQAWVGQLTDLRLFEAQLVATHNVLPIGNHLIQTPFGILGQIGARRFVVDLETNRDVLLSQVGDVPLDSVYGTQLAAWFPNSQAFEGLTSQEAALSWLADQAEAQMSVLNLRQGPFQYRRPIEFGDLNQWRFAAAIALLLSASWFANVVLETNGLTQRTADLRHISGEFVEAGWPEVNGNIDRALALVQSERRTGIGGSPSALTVVAILYDSLKDVPGTELRSVRFESDRGTLSAVVAFESFADTDRLEAAIEARGLAAQANDARQSGGKIVGDVIIGRSDI